ncbi:MAG: hypothetical protein ACRD4Y_16805, partial [Candidatus Acidiferrales bacterium]
MRPTATKRSPVRGTHAAFAFAGLMLAASLGVAQTRGGSIAGRGVSAPARSAARASRAPMNGYFPASASVRHAYAPGISPGRFPVYRVTTYPNLGGFGGGGGVPGLGFDYPHLAAISGSMHSGARRGFGGEGRRGQGYFVPIFFGGFPYYYDDSMDYEQPQQPSQTQPQEIVIQLPPQAVERQAIPEEAGSADGAGASATLSRPAPAEPAQNTSEIVLLRKDGRMLFATAYSVVGSQLRYITPEGILRTFPLSELDL